MSNIIGGTGSLVSTGAVTWTVPSSNSDHYVISYSDSVSGVGNVQSTLKVTNNGQGQISPKLYIKFVKSKLTKIQQKKLKIRLGKLQKMVQNAHDMGQTSMYENLSKMLATVIRESEAVVCGINTYIDREAINKFMHRVKENPVRFDLLEKFPRTIPVNIQTQIKTVQKRKLFDNLHVLYLDYTKEDNRSTKEKIRDKDPILFGTYSYQPDRFYYICDWVDEFCDLTLEKFVDKMKEEDPEFALIEVPDMNEEMFETIKKEVKERHERLSNTNPGNYRGLMVAEDAVKNDRKFDYQKSGKKPWYKGLFGLVR